MVLYTREGWLDVGAIRSHVLPFTWIFGGRGIGKTYGWLKSLRYDDPEPFILLRRSQAMIDLMANEDFSPFRQLDIDQGRRTVCRKINKYIVGFYDESNELEPVAYAMALSTIHNIRGFSAPVGWVIYDEFIPEAHERPITQEWDAFLNAVETIGRNRELQGKEPLRVVGLSNANRIDNPYFAGMGLLGVVDRMARAGQEVYTDQQRGIMLINIVHSPISEAKGQTSLYRLAEGSDFAGMSLGNEFVYESRAPVRRIPLRECTPIVTVGPVTVYRHKSQRLYYCTRPVYGQPEAVYSSSRSDLIKFARRWWHLLDAYLDGYMVFSDYECEVIFRNSFQK